MKTFMSDSSSVIRMYIEKNKFWFTTTIIAILQVIFTCILIFGASDNSVDIELFIIVLMYILLQAIPIRLFFGIGMFDIAVLIFGYFTTVGFSINELILFRTLIFFVISTEIIFILFFYSMNKIIKNRA